MGRMKKIISLIFIITLFSMSFLLPIKIENTSVKNDSDFSLNTTAIVINGNAQLAAANMSAGADGTEVNPYIIRDQVIDGAGVNCISIRNTDAYFIIQNCTVFNGLNGIYFENVFNGEIRNNTLYNNRVEAETILEMESTFMIVIITR